MRLTDDFTHPTSITVLLGILWSTTAIDKPGGGQPKYGSGRNDGPYRT